MNAATGFPLLIIEDNEDDYFLLTDALRREEIHCREEWHRSGEAGLAALGAADRTDPLPGLIICDLDMPGMGGHAVLERIRLDERLRSIPVMILTGSTSSDDRAFCTTADHYFIKPKTRFEWGAITSLIKRYADKQGQPDLPSARELIASAASPLILHIEDHADDRELFMVAFARSGVSARVYQVASSEEAQRFLRSQPPPALVVLDLTLPGSSGRELLVELRASPALCQTPVIILSGSDDFADIRACRHLYVIDYVVKPTNERQMGEFINTLRQWFSSTLAH